VALRNLLAILVLCAVYLVSAGTAAAEPGIAIPIPCQHTAIPAYFGIGPEWDQVVSLGQQSDVMIVNLADGPGPKPRADYRQSIQRARQSGAKVVGYVYTQFGSRDPQLVKTDIDNFKNWFAVDGIFVDNVAWEPEKVGYYRDLHDYIKSTPGGFIVGNPGLVPDRQYMDTSDIMVVFEGTYDSYVSREFPAWVQEYSSDRFSHLVYDTNGATAMSDVIRLSASRNAGYLYVTDGHLPWNWQTLPNYWSAEVDALRHNCFSGKAQTVP
jgi:Spherulation-specific family 4